MLLVAIACITTPDTTDSVAASTEAFACPAESRFWSPEPAIEACVDAEGELHGPWQRWEGEVVVARTAWVHGIQDGPYTSRHADGSLKVTGAFEAGEKDGLWSARRTDTLPDWEERWQDGELQWRTEYGIDGELKSEVHFAEGKRDGVATWYYSDGTPRNRIEYAEGRRHGQAISWHPTGGMRTLGAYDLDRRTGTWFTWTTSGELVSEESWSAGELVAVEGITDADPICPAGTQLVVERHEHGAVEVCETPAGILHGPSTARYDDGSLRRIGEYTGGRPSGEWMTWCPDGLPASRGTYSDGHRSGEWTTWSCATGELIRVETLG